MIIGFDGGLGSGKTIGVVRYLLKDFANGNKIYANFNLRNIDYEHLNVLEIMENENLNNVSIGIDEITVFMDCRMSSSKLNRLLSYFILQTRKRNVNLYYTTQSFNMVDIRLYNHTHFRILCDFAKDEHGNRLDNIRKYTIIDCRDLHNLDIKRFYLDISTYFDFYDTNEVIMPPI
jgi:hypothetical protein